MPKDYYQILGVSKGATDDEIKKSFRRLAHQHHPDKGGGDEQKFKDVNEAYQILSDKQKRATYDQFGSSAFENGGAGPGPGGFGGFGGGPGGFSVNMDDLGDLGDVLGEMFGFGGGRSGGGPKQSRGRDIEMEVSLTFKESIFGVQKKLKLYKQASCSVCKGEGAEPGSKQINCTQCGGVGQVRQQQRTMFGVMQTVVTCPDCHGRGKKPEKPCKQCSGQGVERREQTIEIMIPPGVSEGEMLKVASEGEAAPHGGRAGDLFVRIHVHADSYFERSGHDLFSTVTVPFSLLALGGDATIPTIDGDTVVKITEGTTSGQVVTIKSKGVPYARSSGRGDHKVTVIAEVPKRPTAEQKELLNKMKEVGL